MPTGIHLRIHGPLLTYHKQRAKANMITLQAQIRVVLLADMLRQAITSTTTTPKKLKRNL